jgi:hypothetical protein
VLTERIRITQIVVNLILLPPRKPDFVISVRRDCSPPVLPGY